MGQTKYCLGHLLSILKREIKDKVNVRKITFYVLKVLKVQVSR
jgi:hypothetical protein